MLKDLIKLANHLDQKGLRKEADTLDRIIKKIASGKEVIEGVLYTPLALERMFGSKEERGKNALTPTAYSTFWDHWKAEWKGSIEWEEYQKHAKEMNPQLNGNLDKIKDGEVYSAPIPSYD